MEWEQEQLLDIALTMAHSPSDWSTDANEAFRLSLGELPATSLSTYSPRAVRAQDDRASLTAREAYEGFHPTFTYPVSLSSIATQRSPTRP